MFTLVLCQVSKLLGDAYIQDADGACEHSGEGEVTDAEPMEIVVRDASVRNPN